MRWLFLFLIGCGASDVAGTSDAMTPADAAPTCEGTCTTTALTATFMATRTLDVAYYGTNSDFTLYVEAYKGAAAGCPTMSSPSPDYTLILGRVSGDTSPASFIDFKGDMLPSVQPAPATAVTLTAGAFSTMYISYDVILAFASGSVSGHFYATHCDSLDR